MFHVLVACRTRVHADGARVTSQKRERKPALAAGPTRWWSKNKPQLAVSRPDDLPDPATPQTALKVLFILRFIVVLTTSLLLVGVAAWLMVSMTLLPTAHAGGQAWLVQSSPYPVGKIPPGTTVYVLERDADLPYQDRFTMAIDPTPQGSLTLVAAAPYSTVRTNKAGYINVNGETTQYFSAQPITKTRLGNEYLMLCQRGSCGGLGNPIVIPTDYVLGKVLGSWNRGFLFNGFGPVPNPNPPSER